MTDLRKSCLSFDLYSFTEPSWAQLYTIIFLLILLFFWFHGENKILNSNFLIDVTLCKILTFILSEVLLMFYSCPKVKVFVGIAVRLTVILSCIENYKPEIRKG